MVLSTCCRVGSWWSATRLGRAVNSMIRYQFIMEAPDKMRCWSEQSKTSNPWKIGSSAREGLLIGVAGAWHGME